MPDRDVTCVSEHLVIFDGPKFRHYSTNSRWRADTGGCDSHPDLVTYDGEQSRRFQANGVPGQEIPKGYIYGNPEAMDARSLLLLPLFAAIRPRDPEFVAFGAADFVLSGRLATINGRKCSEVVEDNGGAAGASTLSIWVDLDSQSLPVRIEKVDRDRQVLYRLDISNAPHPMFGSLPTKWTCTYYKTPRVLGDYRAVTLAEAEINPSTRAEDFTIDFPRGTKLYDGRTREYSIVKDSGYQRKLSSDEASLPYDQIVNLPGPVTPIDKTTGWWHWWYAAIAVAAIASLAALRARMRGKRA